MAAFGCKAYPVLPDAPEEVGVDDEDEDGDAGDDSPTPTSEAVTSGSLTTTTGDIGTSTTGDVTDTTNSTGETPTGECGDGRLGMANNDYLYGGCREDCTPGPGCNDGVLQPEEECDGAAPVPEGGVPCAGNCRMQARVAFVTAAEFPGDLDGLAARSRIFGA